MCFTKTRFPFGLPTQRCVSCHNRNNKVSAQSVDTGAVDLFYRRFNIRRRSFAFRRILSIFRATLSGKIDPWENSSGRIRPCVGKLRMKISRIRMNNVCIRSAIMCEFSPPSNPWSFPVYFILFFFLFLYFASPSV